MIDPTTLPTAPYTVIRALDPGDDYAATYVLWQGAWWEVGAKYGMTPDTLAANVTRFEVVAAPTLEKGTHT